MNIFGKEMQKRIKDNDLKEHLQKLFPNINFYSRNFDKSYTNALEIAKNLRIEPKGFIQKLFLKNYADNLKLHGKNRKINKRSTFSDLNLSEISDSVDVYTFDATNELCEKCQALMNTRVTQNQWNDEIEMRNLGFWKQKDGIYRPHPNCKCSWKKETINFSEYSWEKIKNDDLATYRIILPVPVKFQNVPLVLQKKLSDETDLDFMEFSVWAQNFSCIPNVGKFETEISIEVPNIWICADLMHDGNSFWDYVINLGGTIGQAVSYLGTWNKKEIHCIAQVSKYLTL